MSAKATHVIGTLVEEGLESSQAALAGHGKGHGELPGPCRISMHRFWTPGAWFCQTLELGPHGQRALARVRVRFRDVARVEATPVS